MVSIEASRASGYIFGSWSGSGLGSYTGLANPASVTLNGPVSETATLSKLDIAVISAVTLDPRPVVRGSIPVTQQPTSVLQGSSLSFTVDVLNVGSSRASSLLVQLEIYGPDGTVAGSGSRTISRLNANSTKTLRIAYAVSKSAPPGAWTYNVFLYQSGSLLDQKAGSFTVESIVVAGTIVSFSASPDPVARQGTAQFAVTVKNTGNTVWSRATITVKIYGPDGTLVAAPKLAVRKIQPGAECSYVVLWKVRASAPTGIYRYEIYINCGSTLAASNTDLGNTITII
jgi:hypothetical protein